MKKHALLALLLALLLTLTGCSLVVKDPVVDAARTVISVNGEVKNKEAFMKEYDAALFQQQQLIAMYQSYGLQAPAMDEAQLLQDTLDNSVRQMVLEQKAKELKLDVLTPEEQADADEDAKSHFESELNYIKSQFFAGTTLEGDALDAAVRERAAQEGITEETFKQDGIDHTVMDKLRADAIKDVTVTAEEIQAEFDTRVENDKQAFADNLNGYGQALLQGTPAYFVPAGYRYVKQVLVKFTAEDQTAIDSARAALTPLTSAITTAQTTFDQNEEALKAENLSAEDLQALTDKKAELQAALDQAKSDAAVAEQNLTAATEKGYAGIAEKAQEVYTRALGGENFDELIKEFNEDPGQPSQGYAIRKGFTDFDEAFVTPAMALENPGDVAEPSKGMYGYYIVQYAAPVKEGAVDLTTVKDAIQSELLTARQEEVYESTVQQWISASEVSTFPEVAKD